MFQRNIDERIDLNTILLSNPNDIDAEITKFTKIIFDAMDHSIPKRTHTPSYLKLTPYIKQLITHRNITKRQYQRTSNNNKFLLLKSVNKQIKFQITKLRNNSFNSKIQTLNYASKQFWKFTKLIKNKRTNLPPLKKDSNTIIYTNAGKAQLIAETIYKSHLLTQDFNHQPTIDLVNHSIDVVNTSHPPVHDITPFLTTPSEVKKLIKRLKLRKAPGH